MRYSASYLLAWCVPCLLTAQTRGPIALKPATGAVAGLPNPVSGVRELSDGTVLIAYARTIAVADFNSGARKPIPDISGGILFELSGDSTLMVSSAGWILLDGIRPVGMLPASNPTVTAVRGIFGADSTGYLLAVTDWQAVSDSIALMRVARANGASTSVAKTRMPSPVRGGERAPAYSVAEQGVLFLDGWIAVLRAHPYRVDWRSPQGVWTRGAPLPVPATPMVDREKAAYIARSVRPPGVTPDAWMKDPNWWPEFVEPFVGFALHAAPGDEVLVERTPTADYPMPRYDVVNRRGEIVRQVRLEEKERIIGFGPHDVFVIRQEAGLAQIDRHPWP